MASTNVPLHESFDNGIGDFTDNWNVDASIPGQVTLRGPAGLMQQAVSSRSGQGYGTYTTNAKMEGNVPGPAIILWPGDNKWPGQEVNLAEVTNDGTGRIYGALHWNDNGDHAATQIYNDVLTGVFHEFKLVWEPGQMTYLVDGATQWTTTQYVPLDYDHGGMNNVIGWLNTSYATSMTVTDIDYVPLVEAAPSLPVAPINPSIYRFYNTATGGHFFTPSPSERDIIKSSLPDFRDEGVAFTALAEQPGADPVFRFYNSETKTHFFTANVAERDAVLNSSLLRYEGVGFFASDRGGEGLTEVFRFYNTNTGVHFYTSSVLERSTIQDTLSNFRYEGVGFYVPDAKTYDLFG